MQYFPMFLDLKAKEVLVVGGGEVACRKVETLVRANAIVTIISPAIEGFLRGLVDRGECHWVQNFYSHEMMDRRFVQVWATTDNPDLNHQVYRDATKLGILVNVVDDLPYCDFITPSIVNRGRFQIAISSGGASPVLVRNIRQKLEYILPQNLSLLGDFAASKRNDIKQKLPSVDLRRKYWERFFADPAVESAANRQQLEQRYQSLLSDNVTESGSVTWIEFGADFELLSLKALRLMQQAELVLHSIECPFVFVDSVRRDAERLVYRDEGQLNELLSEANKRALRIVVFIEQRSAKYNLLIGDGLRLKLAQS
ncbi:precorrin-2 dehydrogenase/sirohydrochlorin ferrochelatase family protein [Vibrio panuliri]|uniref:precorrin-2 dehydrogenase n=1 Tax=Vibrio panuliri TaxID=1381081 RepID=A0ABX3FRP7_9VIBR|nr:NAD(P)-dependent oxidoreductase [Vibrio panuliri]KAB1454434.1 siroheme synthase [Vibrio panuliri]OLQ96582.1 ferrochelatase [Vibrio panuliri]